MQVLLIIDPQEAFADGHKDALAVIDSLLNSGIYKKIIKKDIKNKC